MTTTAQRPVAVRTWPCAICGHEIQKADGVDSRPTGRRFCRDENACRARAAAHTTTIEEAGMPEVPEFVQEATVALAPPPDPTSARLIAAEAVLYFMARQSPSIGVGAAQLTMSADFVAGMPAAVQTHAEFTQDDPVSPVIAKLPARILALYALGRSVTPLDRTDDF